MEKISENEAVTFILPKADFSQRGSYFCEYQKKLPNKVIYYPQGNTAELSVTGIVCFVCPIEHNCWKFDCARLQSGFMIHMSL